MKRLFQLNRLDETENDVFNTGKPVPVLTSSVYPYSGTCEQGNELN